MPRDPIGSLPPFWWPFPGFGNEIVTVTPGWLELEDVTTELQLEEEERRLLSLEDQVDELLVEQLGTGES